jgi:hypothetical protein
MTYKFVPISYIQKYVPEMEHSGISEKARSPGQFLSQYAKYGQALPAIWLLRRNAFINRFTALFKINPTRRIKLALLCWAYRV